MQGSVICGSACRRTEPLPVADARSVRLPGTRPALQSRRVDSRPRRSRADRQHAAGAGDAARHRPVRAVPEARIAEPRRLDQGPHRPVDDRGRRARRPPQARRHRGRSDRRQHRPRPGAGGARQGLPRRPGRARQDVDREGAAPEGARRRGAHHALRRRQGPSRVLPGPGRAARAATSPARSSSTSSTTPPTRWRTRRTTGPEIWAQMEHDVDAIVVRRRLGRHDHRPDALLPHACSPTLGFVLADPVGSILAEYTRSGTIGTAGSWAVEGIGEDFIPVDRRPLAACAQAYSINDEESFGTARELLRAEGILGGSSTGTLLAAALRYCREQTAPKRVVSFVCDTGTRYLSKIYNDQWMIDQGLLAAPALRRPARPDRRAASRTAASSASRPTTPCSPPIQRMRLADVSQLPVLDGGRLVGVIDESDLLLRGARRCRALPRPGRRGA